jgi:LCP family protein required for cell wall assembly
MDESSGAPRLLDGDAPAPVAPVPPPAPTGRDPYTSQERRRRVRRIVVWVLAALLVIVLAVLAALFAVTESLGNRIQRVPDVFTPLNATARPAPTGQLTFLLIGRDSTALPAPADTFLLATADQSRTTSSIVALPPSTVVDVPGHGRQRLDAVQAIGGASAQVSAVETLTNVHVDHYAVLDFGRSAEPIDRLGGIDVGIAQPGRSGASTFVQGTNHLSGPQVLDYLRQPGLPRGDLDRVQRQQAVMRGFLYQMVAALPGGPVGIFQVLDAVSGAVAIDDTLTNNDLRGLGLDLRGMRPAESVFLTAPTTGPGDGGAAVLDENRAAALWQAVRSDSVAAYGQQNPTDVLGGWGP